MLCVGFRRVLDIDDQPLLHLTLSAAVNAGYDGVRSP